MKKCVVSYLNFFENKLLVEVIEVNDGDTWKDIYFRTAFHANDQNQIDYVKTMPDDLEEAKELFLDLEEAIEFTFI